MKLLLTCDSYRGKYDYAEMILDLEQDQSRMS